jgi:hypothetical protein
MDSVYRLDCHLQGLTRMALNSPVSPVAGKGV